MFYPSCGFNYLHFYDRTSVSERDWLFAVLNVVLDVPLFVVDSNQIGHVDVGAHFYAEIVAGQEIPS